MSRHLARVLAALCLCGIAGAATSLWLDVPFVKQEKQGCGAAAIAMVMQYWAQQRRENPETIHAGEIQQALYSKSGHGIYASDMEAYFQQHSFRTFAFQGQPADLKQHLEKGRPLIVALKTSGATPLHYVVVAGLDEDERVVLVNDPAQRKLLKFDQAGFEKEWSAAGKWTLLALPQSDAR